MALAFAIRTDATAQMATGHLSRCLSIADALKSFGVLPNFILGDEKSFSHNRRLINSRGFEAELLEAKGDFAKCTDWEHETKYLCDYLIKNRVDFLLIDSYLVTATYLKNLMDYTATAYLDDLGTLNAPANILINYNHYCDEIDYNWINKDICRLITGTKYAPLRAEFAQSPDRDYDKAFESILITTGGTDEYHITYNLTQKLLECHEFKGVKIMIAAGPLNLDIEALYKLEIKHPEVYVHEATPKIRDLMMEADAAISAGGSTLYELCACHCPTVTFSQADNQLQGADGFAKKGIIPYAGDVRQDFAGCIDRIKKQLLTYKNDPLLRRRVGSKMGEVTDGLGANRIAQVLANWGKIN